MWQKSFIDLMPNYDFSNSRFSSTGEVTPQTLFIDLVRFLKGSIGTFSPNPSEVLGALVFVRPFRAGKVPLEGSPLE